MAEVERKLHSVVGVVVSDAMDKTIVVRIERRVKHPLYGKVVRRFTKLHAHDPNNECRLGDTVSICPARPLSKQKRWKLIEIKVRPEMVGA